MDRHQITKIRREARRRTVTVAAVEQLTPQMRRIGFTSPDLADFSSGSHDDHIKLFLPAGLGGGGEAGKSSMRDYTPRAFDPARGTLTIDFALHDAGPATEWARRAEIGATLEIGGPRGSTIVPDDFDWYMMIGDETALPAIARRLEELRPGVPVTTIVIVDSAAERQEFKTATALTPIWVIRNGADDATALRAALAEQNFPAGDGFIFVAAEAGVSRALRSYLIESRGHPRTWLRAAGYWAQGRAATHVTIED